MPFPIMTYEIAMAAARDAGNRAMRADGRKEWSVEDYNIACAEFERLWPVSRGGAA